MSVDERLVKYASNNTTPLSTMKTFDYPDSFSMSSWSQVSNLHLFFLVVDGSVLI